MKIKDLLEITQVLVKYAPDEWVAAEHDEIFLGSYEVLEQMTPEDQEVLERHFVREEYDCMRFGV